MINVLLCNYSRALDGDGADAEGVMIRTAASAAAGLAHAASFRLLLSFVSLRSAYICEIPRSLCIHRSLRVERT